MIRFRSVKLMTVAFSAVLALAFMTSAKAGILIEGRLNDIPLRMEIGDDLTHVRAAIDGVPHLVDIERGKTYRVDGDRWHLVEGSGQETADEVDKFELADWGNGPPVAGHGSRLNVLRRGEAICAEVLASSWMTPFMAPAVEAFDVLIGDMRELRPTSGGQCGAAPFAALAANGWPLVVGWQDASYYTTETVRFDHDLAAPDLTPEAKPTR